MKTTFVSYLNATRKGCPGAMKICVQTILGLIRWKTTSSFSKMEDNLNFLKNGRRPQFFERWKTISIF